MPERRSPAPVPVSAGTSGTSSLPEGRDGFKFRSGRLTLDFLATLAARRKPQPKELLASPPDLDRWLRAAGLPVRTAKATLADVLAARELREALYRLVQASLYQQLFALEDRKLVNRWAATRMPALQLGLRPGFAVPDPDGVDLTQALAAIARDGVALLSSPNFRRIRNCECAGCSILFFDSSRSGRRRWCSMAACGNKEKVAAHRKRRALS